MDEALHPDLANIDLVEGHPIASTSESVQRPSALEVTGTVLTGLDSLGRHAADNATLCRIAGVSERSLQLAFNEVYGEPPSVVLRRRALHRVRQALLLGDPGALTVSSIALDHGFNHFSRFAQYYQEQYGELPSTTLRRRPVLTRHT